MNLGANEDCASPRFYGKRRTPRCSTTRLRPVAPGSGVVGQARAPRPLPLGYYKDPEKTAAHVRRRTPTASAGSSPGDMATVEADGTLTLLGRGSVCINSGGEKIFPEEVEAALKSHPAVFDAVVVGVPDERWGERVAAVVQPRPGHALTLRGPGRALPHEDRGVQGAARAHARRRDHAPAERQARLPLGQGARDGDGRGGCRRHPERMST